MLCEKKRQTLKDVLTTSIKTTAQKNIRIRANTDTQIDLIGYKIQYFPNIVNTFIKKEINISYILPDKIDFIDLLYSSSMLAFSTSCLTVKSTVLITLLPSFNFNTPILSPFFIGSFILSKFIS